MSTPTIDEKALLPCPFCGSADKPKLVLRVHEDVPGYHVLCNAEGFGHEPDRGCGAESGWGETEAEAIAAWNRRAPLPSLGAKPVARKAKPLKDGDLVVDIFSRDGRVYRVYGDHTDGMVPCQINPTERAFHSNGINRLMVIDPKSVAQWFPHPSPAISDEAVERVSQALEWAMDEIDTLSNRLSGFAYPQGMAEIGRAAQLDGYRKAVDARRFLARAALEAGKV